MIINDLYNNKKSNLSEGIDQEDPLELSSDYALYIANSGRKMMTQLTNMSRRIPTDTTAAQNAKQWRLGDFMHQHYETDDLNAINQVFEEYGVGGFFEQNLYDLLSNWSTQGPEYVNTWKQYSGDVLKNSTRQPSAQSVHEQDMAEGKKRSDTYHIVNKDGKPANLTSYADKESAVKDRDAKHQGAEVRQLGPRGKVKGVAEGPELKQAKRKYNQAAKDANLDQVGAGKKIDTMKKSLRQKDLDKKQGMAEGNPVPGQNFTTAQGQQMNWNPTTKSWASSGPVVPSDGFDVVSNTADMRTTDTGNKPNSTYTSTTVQKNPTTGQQKSLSSWDHTDPATGKRYVGSNYIDAQGNVETQKNYQESKKTKVDEVSLGDYRKKAAVSQATSKIDRFFGRDDPAKVARADQTIAKRERGMARADARIKPYTAPPVDQDKQRRDLADKYPDIDELVRQAELNRDPNYEYADGQAYYNGRDAEHKYHKLKQIQRMIRGAELDEMDFGGVQQTTDSANGDVTTSFNQGPISVTQTKTPGGYTKQTDQQFNLGTATMGVKTAGPNIGAGQLAGTTTATATNNQTGQAKQQVRGVGFGGATGANVGKNYVGATNDELAKHAADSFMGANENIDRIKHLAGIKPVR
jgi:hypothetical protein